MFLSLYILQWNTISGRIPLFLSMFRMMEFMMGDLIKGPWKSKPQYVGKHGKISAYKLMDFFSAICCQEAAFSNDHFVVIYLLNQDYSKCFLIVGSKDDVLEQMEYRKEHHEQTQKIIQHYKSK